MSVLIPEMYTVSVAVYTVLARDPYPEESLEIRFVIEDAWMETHMGKLLN